MLEDEEGSDLPSLAAAKEHALTGMQELVGDAIKTGNGVEIEAIVLADERGRHLAAVPLVMALPPTVVAVLKHLEKIVLKNRLEEYRRHADECRGKAAQATDAEIKCHGLSSPMLGFRCYRQASPQALTLLAGPSHSMKTPRLRTECLAVPPCNVLWRGHEPARNYCAAPYRGVHPARLQRDLQRP